MMKSVDAALLVIGKRRKALETAAGQMEDEVPDLAERVRLSRQEEEALANELDGMDVSSGGGMEFR